jgi:hypothetical protein
VTEVGVIRDARVPWSTRRTALVVVTRYAVLAALAVALAAVHIRRPATVCLVRAATGVPCPFCGGTTAMVRLGHGDAAGALQASPLAVALVAALPFVGRMRAPRWWQSPARRRAAVVATLLAAEVWQLLRLGVIHL